MSVSDKRILDVLEAENRWLAFDELYSMVQCDCDWTDFALQLEQLVEQGDIEYSLPYGINIGLYRTKRICPLYEDIFY